MNTAILNKSAQIRTENGKKSKVEIARARALIALLENSTVVSAAEACGLSRTTLHGLLRTENFRKDLAEAQASAVESAIRRMSALAGKATDVLEEILLSKTANEAVKFGVSKFILEKAFAHEIHQLETRLDRIEQDSRF